MWHSLLPAPLGSVEALKWSERCLVCWQGGCTAEVAVAGRAPGQTWFEKVLHGYIGSADEQAPQFLQERRMDGDVKIPIWNVFFWAHWNILFICFIKNNQLFSSFFSQSQHSEKTVVTESQLAFIVFKVLERKKLCGWVVMTFLFTICTDFCERDGLLPKPVNKPLVWLCVYSQHGSCDQSHLDEALLTCLE